MNRLSLILLSQNGNSHTGSYLKSLSRNVEILVSYQTSIETASGSLKKNKARMYPSGEADLGTRKQFLISKAKGDWILILDDDERVSEKLFGEIQKKLQEPLGKATSKTIVGYRIPYQNHVFGKPVYYGGEKYSKVRLFRRGFGRVSEVPLHEEVEVSGRIANLTGTIEHHSYRTPSQLFGKFTRYAKVAARMMVDKGQMPTGKELFMYGPHMFYARFIKDQGYRDGWQGFVLAFAFGYMEGLTYWFLFLYTIRTILHI